MIYRRTWLAAVACAIAVGGAHAADGRGGAKDRGDTRAVPTPPGGSVTPPLQTGEVKVPEGGVDTSRFDPSAGEGAKGRSTSGGGVIVPRGPAGGAAGGTKGAPLSGAAPRDAVPNSAARGERGSGTAAPNSGGTISGGGKERAGSGSR